MTVEKKKYGSVTLLTLDAETGHYEIRFYDPAQRNTARRRFHASSKSTAIEAARKADRERLRQDGILPKAIEECTIEEAIATAISASAANARTRDNYSCAGGLFHKWIANNFPELQYWREILPLHVNAYLLDMAKRDYAGATISLHHVVIGMTGKYFFNNYNMPNPTRGVKTPKTRPSAERPVLSEDNLLAFLAYMREAGPVDLSAVLHLQGLCGLRMLEAVNLRECDVDLNAGTVEITDTARHKPKTRSSWRVIPVPGVVVDVLRYAMTARKVKGPDSLLFPSPRHPARTWEMSGISKALMRCFDRARLSGLNIPAGFIPRKLRASFVTMATRANVRENYLQRYVGHAPESILTKHYTSTTLDDLKREVLQPVIAYLSKIDREGVHHAQS
jgi:integrase